MKIQSYSMKSNEQKQNLKQFTQLNEHIPMKCLQKDVYPTFQTFQTSSQQKHLKQILTIDARNNRQQNKLLGGGNIWSQNPNDQIMLRQKWLEQWQEDKEEDQQSCQYVKNCLEDLKSMIEELTNLSSNSKTYCYSKFKGMENAFFENKECHPLLLEFFELCADRLLYQMDHQQLFATEDQKNELIKNIDNYILLIQHFQDYEPLQNHIFYLKLIRQIFNVSQSIQTGMQKVLKHSHSLFQVFVVIYKQDKEALRQLGIKCKHILSIFRQSDKIKGIIQYTSKVLDELDKELSQSSFNSFSTKASYTESDFSRQSTGDYSQYSNSYSLGSSQNQIQGQMQVKGNNINISNLDSYEIELKVKHESIDLKSHFRVQYYALMQLEKVIQRMIDDPNYQIRGSQCFYDFIHNEEKGMLSYSERQYWFKKLESISFERHLLLRYISLSVLIKCFELFTLKSPQDPLLKDICQAIYYRFQFEPRQKIQILFKKNKELLKMIQNMNTQQQQKLLIDKALFTSNIIDSSEDQEMRKSQIIKFNEENDSELDSQSYSNEDFEMLKRRVYQIKSTTAQKGEFFIQSRISHQNYVNQQYNIYSQSKSTYIEQDSYNSSSIFIKNISNSLIQNYFRATTAKRAIVIQGDEGTGKTSLAVKIHSSLIDLVKEQMDEMHALKNQVQSSFPQFNKNSNYYTPILLKLQNTNMQKESLTDLFELEYQPLMSTYEFKVVIIDGLSASNWVMLSQVISIQMRDWKNYIFIITSTCSESNKIFSYNECVLNFLNSVGFSSQEIQQTVDGYSLCSFNESQIKKFIDSKISSLQSLNNLQNKNKLKNQLQQEEQLIKQIQDKIGVLKNNQLTHNPLILQMIYKILYKFNGQLIPLSTEKQIFSTFTQVQFCSTFKHWQNQNIQNEILTILQNGYIYFLRLIALQLKNSNSHFLGIDRVQNEIIEEALKYIDNQMQQQILIQQQYQSTQMQSRLQDLREQFSTCLMRYFNSDIFDKMQKRIYSNQYGEQHQDIDQICFKHEKLLNYFLSLN